MYHPTREIEQTPRSAGMDYDDVELGVAEGIRIHGWFVPARQSRGTVLFFHGNGGNISHRIDSVGIFHGLGVDVLIMDYEGYGRSGGRPGEEETYRDAEAAWNWLTGERDVSPGRTVIFGRSMGGAIAAYLADRHEPAGLIVESSFTSAPDMAAAVAPWLPFARLICRYAYNSLDIVPRLRCPALFAHSPDDEIVPYRQGLKLFATAAEPKQFLEMRGGHNDGMIATPDYAARMGAFLDAVFP